MWSATTAAPSSIPLHVSSYKVPGSTWHLQSSAFWASFLQLVLSSRFYLPRLPLRFQILAHAPGNPECSVNRSSELSGNATLSSRLRTPVSRPACGRLPELFLIVWFPPAQVTACR